LAEFNKSEFLGWQRIAVTMALRWLIGYGRAWLWRGADEGMISGWMENPMGGCARGDRIRCRIGIM
jgi:hypothetical protein